MFYDIIVVGAGGTGGNLLKELGRFLKFFHVPDRDWNLTIIDGDTVEARNGERQPFFEGDVQQMKALCIQEGLVDCIGLPAENVAAYPIYLDSAEWLRNKMDKQNQSVSIVVGCVDNHRARQVLHEVFNKDQGNIIYIDSANEFDYGEVVVGVKMKGKEICPPRAYYFPEVLTDTSPSASELSCGAINVSSPQHLITNLVAAGHILSTIIGIMQEGRVDGGIIHFNAFTHFSRFDKWVEKETEQKSKTKRKRTVKKGDDSDGRKTS